MTPFSRRPSRSLARRLPLLVLLGGVASSALAQDARPESKGMQIVVERSEPLALTLESASLSPAVGESLNFRVSGNRDFHLYLFSEDLETGERRLLIPTVGESDNRVAGGEAVSVPGAGVRLFRDRPGTERITAIGSVEYIEMNATGAESADASANGGGWPAALAVKGVGERGATTLPPGMALAELDIEVVAAQTGSPSSSPASEVVGAPLAFVSSSCTRCVAEEGMRIGFGADRPGQVTVFVVEPDGTQATLVSRTVDGGALEYVDAVPEAPLGGHALVAVYSEEYAEHGEAVKAILSPDGAKGVRLVEETLALAPHAVRRFSVVEH